MLIKNVIQAMQGSPMQYSFQQIIPSAFIAAHEATSLMLLGLIAQGIPHPSDRMICLHGMQISPSVTVGAIAAD